MTKELVTRKIPISAFDPRQDTIYTWLGMAGVLINAGGTVLAIDPILSMVRRGGQDVCESGYRLKVPLPIQAKDLPRVDAVLYTHADNDHFGPLTARTLWERFKPVFAAPPPVVRLLVDAGIRPDNIRISRDFESSILGKVAISITPALHDWQEENPWQRGDCCGYRIETLDGTIWHPGDTRLIEPLSQVGDVDVLFFDVADVEAHLGPAGSAQLARSSGAKVLVAYHYGTFDLPAGTFGSCDPEDSLPYLADLQADFIQPDPGEILHLPLGD
jgi:L-ascorbate metabolism protein UlaG (beta-lactamase superfamily)